MRAHDFLQRRTSAAQCIASLHVAENPQGIVSYDQTLRCERAVMDILSEQAFGVVLRFLHIGLIEGVDAEQGPGNRGGELPQEELFAQIERIVETVTQHWMAGSFQRLTVSVQSRQSSPNVCECKQRRGRRRKRRAGPVAHRATGTMPLPSLPVLSAMSCSIHSPSECSGGGVTNVSLLRPALASEPSIAPSRAPGFSADANRRCTGMSRMYWPG